MSDILGFDRGFGAIGNRLYESNTVNLLNDVDHPLLLPERNEPRICFLDQQQLAVLNNNEVRCTISSACLTKDTLNGGNQQAQAREAPIDILSEVANTDLRDAPRRQEKLLDPLPTTPEPEDLSFFSGDSVCRKTNNTDRENAVHISKDLPHMLDYNISLETTTLDADPKLYPYLSQLTSPCTLKFSASLDIGPSPLPPLYDTIVEADEPFNLEKILNSSTLPSRYLHSDRDDEVAYLTPKKPLKGNSGGKSAVKKPLGKRKPRTYAQAVPSQHCHICSRRPTEVSPHVVCGNLRQGRCRKTVCEKCFLQFGWDFQAASAPSQVQWICPHCQGNCPPRAQCFIYYRTSARRRQNMINHRKPKAIGDAKSVRSTIATHHRVSTGQRGLAESRGMKRKIGVRDDRKRDERGKKSKKDGAAMREEKESGQTTPLMDSFGVPITSGGSSVNGQTLSSDEAMLTLHSSALSPPITSELIGMTQDMTEFSLADVSLHKTSMNSCEITGTIEMDDFAGVSSTF